MLRLFACVALYVCLPATLGWASSPKTVRVQVVDERGMPVRDAVVELDSPVWRGGRISFPWRMAMAQKNEQFVPGTLVIAKGSVVAFPNLDKVRHSVYSFSKPARFEFDLYGRDQTRTHKFSVSGAVKVGCNIHDAMRGYIRVVDTPFAGKTDANGYISIGNLPAGNAKLTVWHPRLRRPANEVSKSIAASGSHKIAIRLR